MKNNVSEVVEVFKSQQFGDLRVKIIDGDLWFVGVDVGSAIGYKRPYDAIRTFVKDVDKAKAVFQSNGQRRTFTIINENGFFDFLMGSQMPKCQGFRSWVTKEILPAVRRQGTPPPTPTTPTTPTTTPTTTGLTPIEIVEQSIAAIKYVDGKVDKISSEFKEFKETSPLFNIECEEIKKWVNKVVVRFLGGKESAAYQNKPLRTRVYMDLYSQLKREFNTVSYKAIQRKHYNNAIAFIQGYKPPTIICEIIQEVNKGFYI